METTAALEAAAAAVAAVPATANPGAPRPGRARARVAEGAGTARDTSLDATRMVLRNARRALDSDGVLVTAAAFDESCLRS